MSKRSTRAVVMARVEQVFRLRLRGAEWAELREFADSRRQSWGISDGQLRRYIRSADKLMVKRMEMRADKLLARHLLQRRQLFTKCLETGDFTTALRVLDSEARLERLEPTNEERSAVVNVQVNANTTTVLSFEERAARLRQIYLEATANQPASQSNAQVNAQASSGTPALPAPIAANLTTPLTPEELVQAERQAEQVALLLRDVAGGQGQAEQAPPP